MPPSSPPGGGGELHDHDSWSQLFFVTKGQLTFDTDVLVVGGGAAGVAAAFTAARAGARVLLLEKYGFCGGAAVAGLSGTICGLYAAT